jgi:hypothetical protein
MVFKKITKNSSRKHVFVLSRTGRFRGFTAMKLVSDEISQRLISADSTTKKVDTVP